jgi:hypothetical protein
MTRAIKSMTAEERYAHEPRPVQIVAYPPSEDYPGRVYALCDDGTIRYLDNPGEERTGWEWYELPSIPSNEDWDLNEAHVTRAQ